MPKITTTELKKLNCESVYRLLYDRKQLTKQKICNLLELSRPTVTNCLEELLEQKKICRGVQSRDTGGRPAVTYCFNENAKVSIGVEVMAEKINIASVDLYGHIKQSRSVKLAFVNSESYFQQAADWIKTFIGTLEEDSANILGITISFQGILAEDNEHIIFSKLLGSHLFTRSDFSRYFTSPVFLAHDSEMAAGAELWHYRELRNAIYLSVNPYMGSGIVVNGAILHTPNLSSGILEHMVTHPEGRLCYCGKRGCADSYCSINALEREAGCDLPEFMRLLRDGDEKAGRVWQSYLHELAILIDNARMVLPGDVILGGLLAEYLKEEDTEALKKEVLSLTAIPQADFEILIGHYGNRATLVGSALKNITKYLEREKLR